MLWYRHLQWCLNLFEILVLIFLQAFPCRISLPKNQRDHQPHHKRQNYRGLKFFHVLWSKNKFILYLPYLLAYSSCKDLYEEMHRKIHLKHLYHHFLFEFQHCGLLSCIKRWALFRSFTYSIEEELNLLVESPCLKP